jgi:D-galactarolactone cycloisomerase
MEEGIVKIPDGPGLGVEINRDVIERYEVKK